MDPLAHTLFGAALVESGLKRRSRYATATLLIGANLPDVDVLAKFWGRDVELYVRRGWTHGVLAMVALPLLLAAAIWLWHRWRSASPANAHAPPFDPRAIVALSFLSVWSHPALDWLNTYGVRLLMPFDGRWFYGDTLFIIDPWVWVMLAAGVVLARSGSPRAMAGWIVLGALTSWLVLTTDAVGPRVKVAWAAAVTAVVVLRWRRPAWTGDGQMARVGLVGLALYIGLAYGLARVAESAIAARYPAARQVQANPSAGVPIRHRFIVVEENAYRTIAGDGTVEVLQRRPPDAIVQKALQAPSIRGFANWMRFPYWTVQESQGHWIVRVWDLRYQTPSVAGPSSIGFVQVEIPKER